jgi:hypothetical protein
MAIEEITQKPTSLVIRPEPAHAENTGYSTRSHSSSSHKNASGPDSVSVSDGDYSFWDFLDLINPLQHIPVVSTIYREVTGDTIKPELKLAGSTVLGGPLGLVTSLADVLFEQETGKDIGSTLVTSVFGDTQDAPVQVAKVEAVTEAISALQAPISTALPMPSSSKKEGQDERVDRLSQIDPMSKEVLALYGHSRLTQASKAYQQADMRGYLQQASVHATF